MGGQEEKVFVECMQVPGFELVWTVIKTRLDVFISMLSMQLRPHG